jgi:hypothetical protein
VHPKEITLKDQTADDGTIQALLDRLNNWRLPRALELKERVDRGEKLGDHDIAFLERVFADANQARALAARHKELQPLINKLVGLYSHITSKALENEQAK